MKVPSGPEIDAALDEALTASWQTAEELTLRVKSTHPELRRYLDPQRAGRRLSTRAKRGEIEKRGAQAGYYYEWRKV